MDIWYWAHKPGHHRGPCEEPCEHGNCLSAHAVAASRCSRCGERIGYERMLVLEREQQVDVAAQSNLVTSHRECWEAGR